MTDGPAEPAQPAPRGPLSGIRVLEFSQIVAASFGGVNLSDLGADVVKVEPPEGEAYRSSGAIVPNEGKRFQSLNRGKRSLAIDLQRPEGQQLVHRIIPEFDAVLINYRPGVAERLSIDYDTLSAIHPGLVYCSITGFGHVGPWADKGATDLAAGAYSGLIAGDDKIDAEGTPAQMTPAVSDYVTGLACAMSITAALYHRRDSGRGQRIDASLLGSALAIQDFYVMRQPVTDAILRDPMIEQIKEIRARGGTYAEQLEARRTYRWAGAGPPRLYYSGYNTKDRAIVLGCLTKPTRAAARRVLGMEHDETDEAGFEPHDPENMRRVQQWKVEIVEKLRGRTADEWIADFQAAGVPVAPVQIPEELSDDPQVEAMGIMVDFEHEVTGPQRVVGPLVRMSETPTHARRPSPPLARHTDEVLRECGLGDAEIAALRETGAIR